MKKHFKLFFVYIFVAINLVFAQTEKTDFQNSTYTKINENCYFYKLENGLSVFIAENKTVPLAYIEVAVKVGAITQDKETAGLFHLYEHMMFKGNSRFDNSAKVQKALSDMGTASWNGTTGIECVNYFFTVPKAQLENGLEFWNAAIREPLMESSEFEIEKKVVISEIQGQVSNPERFAGSYINKNIFCDAPWQLDPSGSLKNIENATVEQLKKIQHTFYIPENAALFIGGDVEHEKVYELVKNIYGSWKNENSNKEKIESFIKKQNAQPFKEPFLCVMPYEKMSPQVAKVSVIYRGPDSDFDEQNTYSADFFHFALSNPMSAFVKKFTSDKILMIPSSDYIGSGYSTRKRTGLISFSAFMLLPDNQISSRAIYFKEMIDAQLEQYLASSQIVSESEKKDIIQQLKDDKVLENETFSGLLSILRYNWVTNNIEYYKNYINNIQNTTNEDIKNYIKKYLYQKNPMILIYVNPDVYMQSKEEFDNLGFEEITTDKAFWWDEK